MIFAVSDACINAESLLTVR